MLRRGISRILNVLSTLSQHDGSDASSSGAAPRIGALHFECSELEVDKWVLSDFICRETVPILGTRPFPLDEQILMAAAVVRLRPTHIFEWGTHVGKSARFFHETARAFGVICEIHTVDLPDDAVHVEHPGKDRGVMVKGIPNVFLHQGDGLDTSLALVSKSDCARPLFLVDGDHSYESVCRELRGIVSACPNAWVLLHDTFFQSPDSGYNVGPSQAIRDIVGEMSRPPRVLTAGPGLPGMTLLYRI